LTKDERQKWRQNEDVLRILFEDIAPAFKERNGGYTRIVKMNQRQGDAASARFWNGWISRLRLRRRRKPRPGPKRKRRNRPRNQPPRLEPEEHVRTFQSPLARAGFLFELGTLNIQRPTLNIESNGQLPNTSMFGVRC
jgi:hypothetical protein